MVSLFFNIPKVHKHCENANRLTNQPDFEAKGKSYCAAGWSGVGGVLEVVPSGVQGQSPGKFCYFAF